MLAANKMLDVRVLAANGISDDEGGNESKHVKPKTKRSKSQKLAKSQKLFKSGKLKDEKSKKPSKIRNSPNFYAMKAGLSFLTPNVKTAFNRLQLAFTKAPIF